MKVFTCKVNIGEFDFLTNLIFSLKEIIAFKWREVLLLEEKFASKY